MDDSPRPSSVIYWIFRCVIRSPNYILTQIIHIAIHLPIHDQLSSNLWYSVILKVSSVSQLRLTLCDHMDYSKPGLHFNHQLPCPPPIPSPAQSWPVCDPMVYTVHGILQVRTLEWVAFPFSRGSYQPRDPTQVPNLGLKPRSPVLQVGSLGKEPPGKPKKVIFNT